MTDTLIPMQHTRSYGVSEAHAVFFQHRADRGGPAPAMSILIPEAMSYLDAALQEAHQLRARVIIVCDTAEQAAAARSRAITLLPNHRPVAMTRAQAGAWRLDG